MHNFCYPQVFVCAEKDKKRSENIRCERLRGVLRAIHFGMITIGVGHPQIFVSGLIEYLKTLPFDFLTRFDLVRYVFKKIV